MASTLSGKTWFITGASRGIGLAIGLAAAREGANVAIAAKTAEPNPKLPGTIFSAAEEIEKAGGKALPLTVDVRDEAQVRAALDKTAQTFGGVDIVVNNASAISITNSQATDMKRFDLMHQINARGTFMVSKFAVPFLEKSNNPHILMLSPPLDMKEKWFAGSTAYSMAKYGMSIVVLGLAGELRSKGVAVNALWPRTTIATSAIKNLLGGDAIMRASRTPDILADAARLIFLKDKTFTGNFLIDDTFLFENGVRDFDRYRVDPTVDLAPDFFVPEELEAAGEPFEDRDRSLRMRVIDSFSGGRILKLDRDLFLRPPVKDGESNQGKRGRPAAPASPGPRGLRPVGPRKDARLAEAPRARAIALHIARRLRRKASERSAFFSLRRMGSLEGSALSLLIAMCLRMARFCGPLSRRLRARSSFMSTSSTQWRRFSTPQWSRAYWFRRSGVMGSEST